MRLIPTQATRPLAAFAALSATLCLAAPLPAQAIIVFDPSNYSQNVLTAARTLQQINNQIRSLQNQAQSLINQAHNLATIDFPEVEQLTKTLQQVDTLMQQARGIQFHVRLLDRQMARYYPSAAGTTTLAQGNAAAQARYQLATDAFRQTMGLQASVVDGVADDTAALAAIIARSQGAQGALQAQQATNQLLALAAKQQFQLQAMIASQFRSDTIEAANRAQASAEARAATGRFLGSGSAYTAQ